MVESEGENVDWIREERPTEVANAKACEYIIEHYIGKTFYAKTWLHLLNKLHATMSVVEEYVMLEFGFYKGQAVVKVLGKRYNKYILEHCGGFLTTDKAVGGPRGCFRLNYEGFRK